MQGTGFVCAISLETMLPPRHFRHSTQKQAAFRSNSGCFPIKPPSAPTPHSFGPLPRSFSLSPSIDCQFVCAASFHTHAFILPPFFGRAFNSLDLFTSGPMDTCADFQVIFDTMAGIGCTEDSYVMDSSSELALIPDVRRNLCPIRSHPLVHGWYIRTRTTRI